MMHLVAWLLLSLAGWFDGCPCCYVAPTAADASSYAAREATRRREKVPCCMGGRRAPEMATGAVMLFLRLLLNIVTNALLCELAALGLEAVDSAFVMREFSLLKRHCWLTFVIKFFFGISCRFFIKDLHLLLQCCKDLVHRQTHLMFIRPRLDDN